MKRFIIRLLQVAGCLIVIVAVTWCAERFFNSTKARCPNCGATSRAYWYSADQRALLDVRAELKMMHRVAEFYGRHENIYRTGDEPWSDEDQAVANFLKRSFFAYGPRLEFLQSAVALLEAKLGHDALLCPYCKQAELEVRAEDGRVYPP